MQIRKYRPSDCRELAELFYDTVHTVNAGDYTKEQLDAWATGHVDLEAWDRSFREHHTLVALEDGAVIGFGDIDGSGYLDRLYVHRCHQGKGVATALCDRLEQVCAGVISTHASITAKPFFEKRRVSGHPGAAGGTAGRGAHQLRDGKTAVSQGEKGKRIKNAGSGNFRRRHFCVKGYCSACTAITCAAAARLRRPMERRTARLSASRPWARTARDKAARPAQLPQAAWRRETSSGSFPSYSS